MSIEASNLNKYQKTFDGEDASERKDYTKLNQRGDKIYTSYFNGEQYNDDRLFVVFIARCTVSEDEEFIITKIYHEQILPNYKWCVATFRNVERYRAVRVDSFDSKLEAKKYLEEIEPQTPLISLNGDSPKMPLSFSKYCEWKKNNKLQDYDYKKMFLGKHYDSTKTYTNPVETLYNKK